MSNEKHYPLHPNATHPPVMTGEIPLEEYENLKRENAELKAKLETVNDLVKASRKFLDDAMEAPTFEKDKEIARLKESVKFFSDTLHRESDSAKECFRFLMDEGLICGWGITDKFFVTAKYSKESLEKFESQEAENERLKKKLESVQASMYADNVDLGMKLRKTQCALWLDRAIRAEHMKNLIFEGKLIYHDDNGEELDWRIMYRKWERAKAACRAKAKEYE